MAIPVWPLTWNLQLSGSQAGNHVFHACIQVVEETGHQREAEAAGRPALQNGNGHAAPAVVTGTAGAPAAATDAQTQAKLAALAKLEAINAQLSQVIAQCSPACLSCCIVYFTLDVFVHLSTI
jgi:hypothetical protein